jgi:hypothetical protein
LRIVGSGRLKPCRKAISKTHNVARGNRQYEADSTGQARGFTMPSCPWLKEGRIPRQFLGERWVKSRYFLDDSAPPGYD